MLKHLSWLLYFEWMGILAIAWYCWFVVRFVLPRWQQRRVARKKQRAPAAREDYFAKEQTDSPLKDE